MASPEDSSREVAVSNPAPATGNGNDEREFGDYELLEEIGQGGMGVVHRARQASLKRPVAIKVIKPGMDTRSIIARFETERQALALMDHPNIARVFDAGATRAGRPYFVMELVRGARITDYCAKNGFSTRQRLELLIKVCQAVQHAHQKGIIHRDLKPSNILVTELDGEPVPKVIDFGIAKATQDQETGHTLVTTLGQFIGTPAYLSPEQATFAPTAAEYVDTRSDVYSLGVLLYELLTGALPLDSLTKPGTSIEELRRTICEVTPVRPSVRLKRLAKVKSDAGKTIGDFSPALSAVSRDLDWIVMKCLEKERSRRYETANDLASDLQRYLDHEPVVARPPSRLYEFRMSVRRHWVGFGAAAAVMVALAAGLAGVAWQWRRAEASQLLAQQNAYAADMQLAQQAVDRGDLGGALNLLNKYRPKRSGGSSGKRDASDLRGWEWRYLWQFCQSDEKSILARYPSWVGGVVVATNLNLLAVQRGDGWISLWDLKGRRAITNLPAAGSRDTVDYSAQSSLMAAANVRTNGQSEVKLWNLKTLSEITTLPHEAPVISLSLTADGRFLATRDSQDQVLVWDVESGRELAPRFEAAGTGGWSSEGWRSGRLIQFSPDGTRLAYRDGRDRIRVLDWRSGADAVPPVASPTVEPVDNRMLNQITALAFSPDGRFLLWGHGNGSIYLWDLAGAAMAGRLDGHDNWVLGMTFSPDGRHLASASVDQTIRIWSLEELSEVRGLRGHEYPVLGAAWLPDGETLVSGGKDGSVRTWNINKTRSIDAHRVVDALFPSATPDGRHILMLGPDESIGIWDARTLQLTETLTGLGTNNYVFDLSSDGRWLAVNNRAEPKRIRILAWPSLDEVTNLFLPSRPFGISFSPRNRELIARYSGSPGLTGGQTTKGKEWVVGSWEVGAPPTRPFKSYLRSGMMSEDESLAALGYETGEIEIVELPSGRLLRSLQGFSSRVQMVRLSRDGTLLAAASLDEFVKLWEVSSGRELMTLRGDLTYINSIGFSPDGSRLAVGGVGGRNSVHRVKLWDLATQRELLDLPSGYSNVGFSPDGDTLAVVQTSLRSYVTHFWRAPSWEEIEAAERLSEKQAPARASQ